MGRATFVKTFLKSDREVGIFDLTLIKFWEHYNLEGARRWNAPSV